MKRLPLLLLLFLPYMVLNAQDKNLLQKTADTICQCMNKVKFKDKADANEIQAVFLDCFANTGMTNIVALAEERGLDITDTKAMEGIGVELGKELLKMNCDAFLKLSIASAKRDIREEGLTQKMEGVLVRVDHKDFRYLILKDKGGRQQSFIWLEYFDGSDALVGDKVKSYIGKKVRISWKEKEVYQPAAANYFKVKQIDGFSVLN